MSKERGQRQLLAQSSPPSQKSLQRQRKKFSLAFPLSPPNRARHFRQQQPRGAFPNSDCDAISPCPTQSHDQNESSAFRNSNQDAKIRRGESKSRKFSAPVDYRDSGVYLGDPNLDWSKAFDKMDVAKTSEEPPQPSSAPVSVQLQAKRRFQKNVTISKPPPFHSAESSKSLSAIDVFASHSSCVPCAAESVDFECQDEDDDWRFADEFLIFERRRRHSSKINAQRNAQSFSTEHLPESRRDFTDSVDLSDDTCRKNDFKEKLAPKRSSLYRRSRSLADDVLNKRVSESDEDDQKCDGHGPQLDADAGSSKGRAGHQRKDDAKAMGHVHSEIDVTACERKKMGKKKRSIADPIAKKLTSTFLRLRLAGNAMAPPSTANVAKNVMTTTQSKQPSREEVRKWAMSFENLLSHKYGVMLFRLFLQREFSEENIDFWCACEEYKRQRDGKLTVQARQIYNDFVAVQAPKEVNLDSVTRNTTMAALSNPNKHTFEQAQHRIQSLMEKDSYPRFLRSDLYLDLLRKC